jgi:hypothetical protein
VKLLAKSPTLYIWATTIAITIGTMHPAGFHEWR